MVYILFVPFPDFNCVITYLYCLNGENCTEQHQDKLSKNLVHLKIIEWHDQNLYQFDIFVKVINV